jgi:hypothetical protein
MYNQGLFHGTQRWHFENRATNHSSTFTVFNSKMMGVTSGIETAYPSGAPEFTHNFLWGSCCSNLVFSVVFCRSLLIFKSFLLQSPCPSVRSHFRNRYLSFYWKKWFYIWYMALAWWLVPCLPFPGLPHIYFLFAVRLTNERVGVFLARRSVQHLVYSYGAVIKVERWCIVTHHIFMFNKLLVWLSLKWLFFNLH